MAEQDDDTARDEVLFAFHRECAHPSAEDVIAWTERYPKFADDIREHAAIRRDWNAGSAEEASAADDVLLARGRSDALNILHKAQSAAQQSVAATPPVSFDALMAAKSLDIPQLASKIGIARGVLAALVGGRMAAPVGARLVAALQDTLAIGPAQFDAALGASLNAPRLGHAKASGSAPVQRQAYEAIIRDSSMTDEQKSHWLGED